MCIDIQAHFADIRQYANAVEHRLDDEGCTQVRVMQENEEYLAQAKTHNVPYLLIEDEYEAALERYLEELK